ncbi:segregation/condensation protein A [Candidatus Synechococcus calcipolaris G9]|uniref:Segregation and condensation protein A n=1 Tax=Candidatus Synechococcus calcipolaris G9 TaxID=1497997 RepID=A0ABT6ETX9_9SYNE|nr:segregation/condensation protein A [Candidatus Synechococcus calcipolaris]MDG2989367.1 segregation/condensation protein A [Candidatus Synechococcus calcipolaris G9]
MLGSFADTAISILIDLAERGEIDPWDIQVVDVFDRCLQELAIRNQQTLSESGQTFLYAAMLILLKSDRLLDLDTNPEELDLAAEMDDWLEGEPPVPLPAQPEKHLHRRPVAPPQQRRQVTLDELIAHLKSMATQVERHKTLRPQRSRRGSRQPTSLKAITQLAHAENLTEMATEVEQLLISQDLGAEWFTFDRLLALRNDRVGVFWALLFLSSQSKVDLEQEDFYQELRIRLCQDPLKGNQYAEMP